MTFFSKSSKRKRWLSPITARILAINIIALGLLVIGILYLGEYRRGLIIAEVTSMETQGEMFAAALGEGASTSGERTLVFTLARQMVNRLVQKGTRARLFALDGSLMADSGQLPRSKALQQALENETLVEKGLRYAQELSAHLIFGKENLPIYVEPPIQTAAFFPEAMMALNNEYGGMIRQSVDGVMLISVAVPVTRDNELLGALLLSKGSEDIETALFDVRVHIFKVFLLSFAVTFCLSLYFAGTIARPLRLLSRAADALRKGMEQRVEIPDLSKRKDEIGDLSEALRQMTSSLWLRMDAIESFAADVSHELKNPLTSLRSAVETAQRVENPDAQKRLMEVIQHDVDRLDRLISDISEASRVDAEMSRAKADRVDIAALLQTMIDLRKDQGRSQVSVLLNIEEAQEDFVISGMEGRLVQVFDNLISNAITFSPVARSVRLSLKKGNVDELLITVEDDGPGIPEGNEEKIFQRFYTERPSDDGFGNHSGLGLAISKQIVEAHGGKIACENRKQANQIIGAKFTVRLPIS